MSILTDTDITQILKKSESEATEESLVIDPFSNELTPVGYDLRVGGTVATSNTVGRQKIIKGESITISPGATALITSLENVVMPKNRTLSAFIKSKVTMVSKGLSHISTTIDPDWRGNLLIAIHNHSTEKIKLSYGEPFCTVVFIRNISPSTGISNKQPGRLDVFINKFEQETAKAKKMRRLQEFIPPIIVLSFAATGYFVFKNTIGFVALVSIGVAISQYVAAKIK